MKLAIHLTSDIQDGVSPISDAFSAICTTLFGYERVTNPHDAEVIVSDDMSAIAEYLGRRKDGHAIRYVRPGEEITLAEATRHHKDRFAVCYTTQDRARGRTSIASYLGEHAAKHRIDCF